MPHNVQIIFGPPGTGKTTTLLEEIDLFLAGGTAPERIGFFSFSRRAVREAKDRARDLFNVPEEALPWFRTIHSAAFRLLELTRDDVVQPHHLRFFFNRIVLPFSGQGGGDPVERVLEPKLGDRCLGLYHMARARGLPLEHVWREALLPSTPWECVRDTARLYERFKEEEGLRDFSDMLEYAQGSLPLDVLFVDEAQDCSPAQWAFVRRIAQDVPMVYIAGDDDQTIYRWSGADSGLLLRLQGERQVLPLSYRLPRRIKRIADSVIHRVAYRVPKEFSAREEDGSVMFLSWLNQLELHDDKSWLLLARSNRQLAQYRTLCRKQGVVYSLQGGKWSSSLRPVQAAVLYERLRKGKPVTSGELSRLRAYMGFKLPQHREEYVWEHVFGEDLRQTPWFDALVMSDSDKEYIRALRRSGESLTREGRVRILTVHGAKGAEADSVVIDPAIPYRVAKAAQVDPEAELRVQYVAVTRAKSRVYFLLTKSKRAWSFGLT